MIETVFVVYLLFGIICCIIATEGILNCCEEDGFFICIFKIVVMILLWLPYLILSFVGKFKW